MSKVSKFLHDRWGFGGVGNGRGMGSAPMGPQIPVVGGGARGPMQPRSFEPLMPPPTSGLDLDPRDGHELGAGEALKSVGGFAKDYGPLALAGLGAYEGWQQNKKAEEMMDRAIAAEEERKQRVREGIERSRAAEQRRVARPASPIMNEGNPYRRIPAVGGGAY